MPKPQPVLLDLLGVPDNAVVDERTVKTLLTVVYPSYVDSSFDGWWQQLAEEEVIEFGQPLAAEIDDEAMAYDGETNYEYILATFGGYVTANS